MGALELSQCTVKPHGELYLFRAAAEWPWRLPALLPPNFGALRSLQLNSCKVDVASMRQLGTARWGLTQLRLFNCGQTAGGHWFRLQPEALAALMDRAPALQDLTVRACMLGEVPPCITQRRGLTRLCLEDNKLKRLPRGPYFKVTWLGSVASVAHPSAQGGLWPSLACGGWHVSVWSHHCYSAAACHGHIAQFADWSHLLP